MRDCIRCSEGPQGLEGHAELAFNPESGPYGASGGRHVFICLACSSAWERRYEGGGQFMWRRKPPSAG